MGEAKKGGRAKYRHSDDAPIGRWGYKHGPRPPRVTVLERPERGSDTQPTLVARWYAGGQHGPYTVTRISTVRDENGRVDVKKRQQAELETIRIWEQVQAGTDPDVIFAPPQTQQQRSSKTPPEKLTLGEGFDLWLDENEGYFAGSADGDWYSEQERRADRVRGILGDGARWTDVTPAKVRALYVALHAHYDSTEHVGLEESTRTVEILGTARDWLVANSHLTHTAPGLPGTWRTDIKHYWQSKADRELRVHRPAHELEELKLLTAAVRDPGIDMDARFRLLMRHGIGQRLGPVAQRALRSNLKLDDSGRWGLGRLEIPSRPGKAGVSLDLNDDARQTWEETLAVGYLSDLERAYQAGEIDDYYLFPAYRLRAGKAKIENAGKPVNDTWLHDQLRYLEREVYQRHQDLDIWTDAQREAGTMHKRGRGWHGLRRAVVDLCEQQGIAPEIRNAMFGWVRGSRTADEIYAKRRSEERDQVAAETREGMLAALGQGGAPEAGGGDGGPSLDALRDELEAAVEAGDLVRAQELKAQIDELRDGDA